MLPEYTVRESHRAKHVRFSVTPMDGLVVVIPRGFDRTRIPELLAAKKQWLMQALEKMAEHRAAMPSPDHRPDTVSLLAIGETWILDWRGEVGNRVLLSDTEHGELRVRGPIDRAFLWQEALRKWVVKQGRIHLEPWFATLSGEIGVPIEHVSIRCQKTRWGSYSTKGTVSLNAQLLFLPRHLARYVLLHELCHATHSNHSAAFWTLLEEYEPDALGLRSELRTASNYVPTWMRKAVDAHASSRHAHGR